MRFLTLLLLLVVVVAAPAAQVVTGSVYINFENGSAGSNVTGAILTNAAVAHGVSVAYETGTSDDGETGNDAQSVTKIETEASYDVNWEFAVGGTNYSGNTGSRGIRTTGGGANGYIRVKFGSAQYPLSIGFHWRANQTGDDYSQWDMVGFYPKFQLFAQKSGVAEIEVMAHWYTSGQSAASVALTSSHWYWVTMKRETNGNTFTINLYDTDDMSLVTSRTGTVDDGAGASVVSLGGIKYTADWPTSTLDYDNLIVNTNGTFPLLPVTTATGPYWVSSTGTSTWANAQSETALSGTSCASVTTMNTNVASSNIVNFRTGIYATQIDPTTTTPTNENGRVTLQAYNGESVTLSNIVDYAIDLTGMDYYTINNIDATKCETWLLLSGSDYNILTNCDWSTAINASGDWNNGIYITGSSKYNQFVDMVIKEVGDSSTGDDLGGLVTIGGTSTSTDESTHNLFLRCTLARGGHQVVTAYAGYNRWQDCHFYNDPWMPYTGTNYGNRNLLTDGRGTSFNMRNVIDNCTFWRAGKPVDANGVSSMSLRSPNNIVRRSRFVDGADAGISIVTFAEHTSYSPNGLASSNHVYHNVFVYNGTNTSNTDADQIAGLTLINTSGTAVTNNAIKNNIFWDNVADRSYGDEPDTLIAANIFAGNREETSDPLFVDWAIGDLSPSNASAHNFQLTASSTSINAGAWLTTITTGSGSGTNFTVVDSFFFTDGEGIYAGDTIQLQGSTTQLTVTDVNYSTHAITFTPSTSWTVGDGVALTYSGAAPDQGAFESQFTNSPGATIRATTLIIR